MDDCAGNNGNDCNTAFDYTKDNHINDDDDDDDNDDDNNHDDVDGIADSSLKFFCFVCFVR